MDDKLLQLSSIEELKQMSGGSEGELVELPGWGNGKKFVARLKRPSLLLMAMGGQIPNELKGAVSMLYASGEIHAKAKDGDSLKTVAETILYLVDMTLMSPTMAELKENSISLTDEQINAIYLYAKGGVNALAPFREIESVFQSGQNGENVAEAAKRFARDLSGISGVLPGRGGSVAAEPKGGSDIPGGSEKAEKSTGTQKQARAKRPAAGDAGQRND